MTQNNRDFQSLSGTVTVQAQQRGVPAARPAAGEGGPVRLHRPTRRSVLWLYEPALQVSAFVTPGQVTVITINNYLHLNPEKGVCY